MEGCWSGPEAKGWSTGQHSCLAPSQGLSLRDAHRVAEEELQREKIWRAELAEAGGGGGRPSRWRQPCTG